MESEGPVYCICRKPYDEGFMIECDECKDWFHGSCVGVQEHQAAQIERYHCPPCEKKYGPLTLKDLPMYEDMGLGKEEKAARSGITRIIKDIKQRHFPSADEVVRRISGRELTVEFIELHGFSAPIIVEKKDGLDLRVPPPTFSVDDVEKKVGSMFEFEVINVEVQEDYKMFMRQWTEYFNSPGKREKILNVISLEFSKTDLAALVEPPRIVRELSWVTALWPHERADELVPERPEVQKYCLMGVKDSYTDFHIDFGGTSVWYHVLRGEKVFFLIEPTEENLRLFEIWESSSKQNQTFFGDQVDRCWRLVVKQGHTVFIPTAWIHAVYTPIDSLVFGGNFLHSYNIPLQLEAYEIERRLQTNEKYQFPNYETVNWFAAKFIYDALQGFTDAEKPAPAYMLTGAEALAHHLKKWTQRKDYSKRGNDPAQLEGISYGKLIKDLNSILKKFNAGPGKSRKAKKGKGKGKKKEEAKVLSSEVKDKEPMLLRLDFRKHKDDKKVELDDEERKNIYNFQDDSEDELPPANILKVRIPKTEALMSKVEEQKVPPVKLTQLTKDTKSGKRKRKHKKSSSSKKSAGSKKSKIEVGEGVAEVTGVAVEEKKTGDFKLRLFSSSLEKELSQPSLLKTEKMEDEDSDKDNLVVDEAPRAQQINRNKPSPLKPVSFKLKQGTTSVEEPTPRTWGDSSPPIQGGGGNSIADILKVAATDYNSRMAMADSPQLIAVESMLSMSTGSSSVYSGSPFSLPTAHHLPSVKDEEEQLMADCYQEGEYMYPSFDLSDDEQLDGRSTKIQEKDDNWNPKARVSVSNKGEERMQRQGTKTAAVASVLAATSKKLEENPRPVKKLGKKWMGAKIRESRVPHHSSSSESEVNPFSGSLGSPVPGPSTSTTSSPYNFGSKRIQDRTPSLQKPKCKKNKKGYKTAKQRLGKLIKIC